mgnify:CR=1 FL=1
MFIELLDLVTDLGGTLISIMIWVAKKTKYLI